MDKIDKLLDAIDHPNRYSDREMEAMLADPGVREIYDLLDKTKASLTPISAPDVDAEWATFERTHSKRTSRILKLFSRNVAAGIAICIVSIAAVAAVVSVSISSVLDKKTEPQAAETAALTGENNFSADTTATQQAMPVMAPEIIVFDNEPLETIASRIGEYYGCKVEFSSDVPKSLRLYFRWNQAQTVDEVAESLNNFEQIHLSVNDQTIKID